MQKFMMLALVLVGCIALGACSDDSVDPAAQKAERVKLFEEEFKPLLAEFMTLFDKEREAANQIIPIKNQIRGAKKSGNENLAAELQTQLDAATGTWEALKSELDALEKRKDAMMAKLRKMGHKFRGDR